MPFDAQDEIVLIRERLARIETALVGIQRCLEAEPRKPSAGQIIIPVSLLTTAIQGIIAAVQHFV